MKIIKITITNFRSIKSAIITPTNFNIFVGQNNHGKTNFFEAIDWFYSGKGDITQIRCGRSGQEEVSVEIEFDGVQEGITKMKNVKNQTSIKNLLKTDFVKVKRTHLNKVRQIFDSEKEVWIEKNPAGFDSAFNDFLPRFEYVDTKTKLEDVAKYGKNSPITIMLSGVLTTILEKNDSYQQFKNKFDELFGEETSDVRMELNGLSGKVKIYLEKQFPDCAKVEFEVNQPMFEDLLKNFTTTIDDGIVTDASEKGDGMQRALMLAIIQAYADFRKENEDTNKVFLFFIDEAELHLHPSAQRSLKKALLELSEKGDQVFINTHSSVLVADEHVYQSVYKVEKTRGLSSIEIVSEDLRPYVIYELLGGSPTDLLLPHNFLVVEGKSESVFLSELIQRLYPDKTKIQVVYSGGDFEKQKRSMDAINTLFVPLFTNPVYKNKLVILCDKPQIGRETDFANFASGYPYLSTQNQLFVLTENSIEEYYPDPWKKSPQDVIAMGGIGVKTMLAKDVGKNITKEQFEHDMIIVHQALLKCWQEAY